MKSKTSLVRQYRSSSNPAALAEQERSTGAQGDAAASINASPRVAAQRAFNAQIQNSPISVAQKKNMESMAGSSSESVQRVDDELQTKTAQLETDEDIQTKTAQLETDEDIQKKLAPVQRKVNDGLQKKAPLDRSTASQRQDEGSPRQNNTGLPDNLKAGIESLSGISLDGVKVHYNSPQPAQLNALAYAQGTDIHVAQGQEQHLPHEAWHVVQQAQDRVRPTMQMKDGVPINDDAGLEHEADVMGAKAIQQKSALTGHTGESATAQLVHQHEDRMRNRRRFKRSLKTGINRILAINGAGPANVQQINIHDEVQHAGQHHGFRNVTVAQLVIDIRTTIADQTRLNLIDSDNP